MRAELSASLCSPEERPVSLRVDPVKLDARLSGTPSVSADPIELELPEITVTVPEITVEFPNPSLTVTLGIGTDNVVEYLESMRTFIHSLDPLDLTDIAIGLAATAALGPGALQALLVPNLEVEAQLTLGDVKISTDQALTIDGGDVRLHGVPVTDDVLPLRISADLDETGMTALLDGVRAALTGCLVLNGGEPPPAPPCPPATALGADAKVDNNKKILTVTVHGQGFGAVQGTVVLSQGSLALTPVQTTSWTDQTIEVIFQPIPPPGGYVVTVTTAQGVSTQVPVNVPA
jgi:hypothetical protein